LEERLVMASGWRNAVDALDVSGDGHLSPVDFLQVVNELHARGSHPLAARRGGTGSASGTHGASGEWGPPFLDVNGDGHVAPVDALRVLNELLRGGGSPYVLQESRGAVTTRSITIGLGQEAGRRIYRFDMQAVFDTSDPSARDASNTPLALEDRLEIYLVEPGTGRTLLDGGQAGTPLVVMEGEAVSYPAEIVSRQGTTFGLDLTSLAEHEAGELQFVLFNTDADAGTRVEIRPLANEVLGGVLVTDFLTLPGTAAQMIRLDARWLSGGGSDTFTELGLVGLDDASGALHGVPPGHAAYDDALRASSRRRTLFTGQQGPSAQQSLTYAGGGWLGLYVFDDKLAFATPDEHLRVLAFGDNRWQIGWEEAQSTWPGLPIVGDRGYDDAVIEITATVVETTLDLQPVNDLTVNEETLLSGFLVATGGSPPRTFTLEQGPVGATLNSQTGFFSWTPTETQGPSSYEVTVRVSDSADNSDSESFTIMVNEVNRPPDLLPLSDQTLDEGATLTIDPQVQDPDLPANSLVFSFGATPPAGATIDPTTGRITWTPSETQGPGGYEFQVRVTDNGTPALSDTESFTVTVGELNRVPALAPIADLTIDEQTLLTFTATATDPDQPPNSLVFALAGEVPAGASINGETGVFTWTPSEAQGPGPYPLTVRVTDNGTPPLSAVANFTVTVHEVNRPPVLEPLAPQTVDELQTLTLTATGSDPDLPANSLTFTLSPNAPTGASINSTTGQLTWTPSEAQGPGQHHLVVRLSDGQLFAEQTLAVTVREVNEPPVLAPIPDQTIDELATLTLTASATDPDVPPGSLLFALVGDVPPGASINPETGLFTWTPTETQGPGQYTLTVRVTDPGPPALSRDTQFQITVREVNQPPALNPIGNQTIPFGQTLAVDVTASDPDLPANSLTFSLDAGAPAGLAIDPTTGRLTWQPERAETVIATVRVTDNGSPTRSDAETISIGVMDCPFDVSQWTASQTGGSEPGRGVVSGGACFARLVEGDSFNVTLQRTFTVPDERTVVQFTFDQLVFDTADGTGINDAFEAAVVDAAGSSVVHTITLDRDAFFNITEGQTPQLSADAALHNQTVSVDISGVAAGTNVTFIFRLVNNDRDVTTSVELTRFDILPGAGDGPGSIVFPTQAAPVSENIDFSSLSDISPSTTLHYATTSFDNGPRTLFTDVSLLNSGQFLADAPLLLVVDQISDPHVLPTDFDGRMPDGRPYYEFTSRIGQSTFGPGSETLSRPLAFLNPNRVPFTFVPQILAQLNRAPAFTTQPEIESLVGRSYSYDADATDADDDTLTFALMSGPDDMTIDPASGRIAWAPGADDVGNHSVLVEVKDGRGGMDMQPYMISVRDDIPNRPPIITSIPVVDAMLVNGPSDGYAYDVEARDPDTDVLQYQLVQGPAGMSIHADTGLITWLPKPADIGIHDVAVRVLDGRGGEARQDYRLRVRADENNSSPVIVSEPVTDFFVPGFSNPPSGQVTPQRISLELSDGQILEQTISITLPPDDARFADIVIAVDESGSMGGDQEWIMEMIPLLDAALNAEGIGPNRFALTGFGGGREGIVEGHFLSFERPTRYTLYGPNGSVVTGGTLNDIYRDELLMSGLPSNGPYVLVVEPQNSTDLPNGIDFSFSPQLGNATAKMPLNWNERINDRIQQPGQPVEYTFQLTTPTLAYFDSQSKDSRITWTLTGPTGTIANRVPFISSDVSLPSPIGELAPGDYSLTIDGSGTAADYQFRLFDLSTATVVGSSETVNGTFEPRNETDFYQFTTQDIQIFQLPLTVSNVHTSSLWRLFDAAGVELLRGTSSEPGFRLPAAGTYYLLMEGGHSPKEGSSQPRGVSQYSFTLNLFAPPSPTALTLGDTVDSTIGLPSEVHSYAFTLNNRANLYFDSLTNSASLFWSLRGPRGEVVSLRPFDLTDAHNFATPTAAFVPGDYQLDITASVSSADYSFRLFDLASATSISVGTPFMGMLDPPNGTDLYKFDAVAGEALFFDVLQASDVNNSLYRLVDPFGGVLLTSDDLRDFEAPPLPADGTYTLLVEGWRSNVDKDTFEIQITPRQVTSQTVALGSTVDGAITTPGSQQEYTFALGNRSLVYFDSLVNRGDVTWTLAGPTGTLVASRAFNASDSNHFATPILDLVEGDYRLTVDGVGDAQGAFSFRLVDLSSAVPITPGTVFGSDLTPPGETDLYRFDGTAGDSFAFDVVTASDTGGSMYRLVDPFGQVVFAVTTLIDRAAQQLISTGTYTLLVEGERDNVGTDTYTLNVIFAGNTPPAAPSGTLLTLGSTINDTMAGGETDNYTFSLAQRSLLYFDSLTNSSGLFWSLKGPAGPTVTSRRFDLTDAHNFAAPVLDLPPGDYQLSIASTNFNGTYGFRLADLSVATPVQPGVPFGGDLNPPNETDFYRFNAVAGQAFYCDVSAASDVNNSLFRLVDPFGHVVFTSNDLRDHVSTPLLVDGAYTVLVEGWRGNTGNDTYTLNVHPVSSSQHNLTLGGTISQTITAPGHRHEFTFTLSDYTRVHFDSLTDSGSVVWSLTGPVGQPVVNRAFNTSDSLNSADPGLELPPGDYVLTVVGVADFVGDFAFRLVDLADAVPITPGTSFSGSFDPPSESDFYRFDAAAGDAFYFDVVQASDANSALFRLIDPFRGVVFTSNRLNDVEGQPLLASGTYTLTVEAARNNTGTDTYTLLVQPLVVQDFSLSLNTIISNALGTPGAQARYTLDLADDTLVAFDSLTNSANITWSLDGPTRRWVDPRTLSASDSTNVATSVLKLPAGRYTLTIDGLADFTGPYSFRLLDLAAATLVDPGTPFNGQFDPANETDLYRFHATAGQSFYFDVLQSGVGAARYQLVNPLGSVVFTTTSMSDFEGAPLGVDGAYTLVVEARRDMTAVATYSMNVQPREVTTGPLTLGTSTLASIGTPGAQQQFAFSVGQRGHYYLDSLTNNALTWSLAGPLGDVVTARRFDKSDSFDLANPVLDLGAGDYVLTVDGVGDVVADAEFRLSSLADAVAITPGTPFDNVIDPPNETHVYQFDAETGADYFFDVLAASDSNNTLYRLVDPLGRMVFESRDVIDFEGVPLPLAGTYTLLVEAWRANADTDTYQMNLVAWQIGRQPLALNTTTSDSITTPGGKEEFTFSLADRSLLYFDSLTNRGDLVWSLTGPLGDVVTGRRFDRSDSFDEAAPVFKLLAGDYRLTVDLIGDATGTFDFRLVDLTTGTPVTIGTPITADLAPPNETDFYRFAAVAGDDLSFDVVTASDVNNTQYRLVDPFGNILFTSNRLNDLDAAPLAASGTYTLLVEADVANAGNDVYEMSIALQGNTPPALTGTPLTLGTTVQDMIAASETDSYIFSLAQQSLLYFDSLTNSSGVHWSLRGPSGQVVANRRFDRTDAHNFTTPVSELPAGDYQLDVTSTNLNGTYAFRLVDLGTATPIALGTAFGGDLTPPNETELYMLTAAAGTPLYFDVEAANDVNNSLYRLIDPFGNVLLTSNDLRDFEYPSVPFGGTYAVLVEGWVANTGNDTYRLNIHQVAERNLPLTLNQDVHASLTTPGQKDRYSFDVTEQTLFMLDPGILSASLLWTLAGPAGMLVNSQGFDAGRRFAELAPGAYTLTITGSEGFTGDYNFFTFRAADSSPLVPGNLTAGQLTSNSRVAVYQFQGTAGQQLALLPDFSMAFGSAGEVVQAQFVTNADPEDGYSGMDVALRKGVFRDTAAVNVIMVTDEDRDVQEDNVTFDSIFGDLNGLNALLNVVIEENFRDNTNQVALGFDSEGNAYVADGQGGFIKRTAGNLPVGTSERLDYIDLAFALQGAAWDLGELRAGGLRAQSFTKAFIDIKVEEILEQLQLDVEASDPGIAFQNLTGPVADTQPNQTVPFDVRLTQDGQPHTFDLLFTRGGTVGSIPVTITLPFADRARAIDPDGDTLTWSLPKAPAGMQIDAATGTITWPVAHLFFGLHEITVRVEDGRGGFDEQTYTLDVNSGAPGEIRGVKFDDANGDGQLQVGTETPLEGWTIFLDQNRNGMRDTGERFTKTDANGEYAFTNLPVGTYVVAEEGQLGWEQTLPARDGRHFFFAASDGTFGKLHSQTGAGLPIKSGGTLNLESLENSSDDRLFAIVNSNQFATVDSTTGIANVIATLHPYQSVESLAFHDGVLYASASIDGGFAAERLIKIDPETGAVTHVGLFGGGIQDIDGLAFSPDGTLYGTDITSRQLVRIDPNSGAATVVAHLGVAVIALEFTSDGLLWGTTIPDIFSGGPSDFVQIDPDNGSLLTIGPTGVNSIAGLAVVEGPAKVYEIALANGKIRTGVDFGNTTIFAENRSPEITSDALATIIAGEEYRYAPTIVEPDGDPLRFDLPLKPEGMVVDPANGTILWNPDRDDIGVVNVLLRVRDDKGGFDLQFFTIDVMPPNAAPVITSMAPTGPAGVSRPFHYPVSAQDADEDVLVFSLTASPAGMQIDPLSGRVTWTPAAGQLGQHTITVAVDDGRGGRNQQTFALTVELDPANVPPTISSVPRDSIRLGDRYFYMITATDPNGDPLTINMDEAPAGMLLQDALITWTPQADQLGANAVTVRVSDGQGGEAVQSFSVNVLTQPMNHAPRIVSVPRTAATLARLYEYNAQAEDADGDPLFWSLVEAPRGMSIDSAGGTIRYSPAHEQLGSHTVIVSALDPQGAESRQEYILHVRGVNQPPLITSRPLTEAAVGQTYLYAVGANDADGDTLSFSLNQAPAGMTIDADTGQMVWTPQPADVGNQDAEVLVSDSAGGFATQRFTIAVLAGMANQPPEITTVPSFFASVDQLYTYDVDATDPERQTLTYLLLQQPAGMTIDPNLGLIEFTPAENQLGTTLVQVLARDPQGAGSLQTYSLTVRAANNAPAITSQPPTTGTPGRGYRYDVLANDPDGEPLTYQLLAAPAGMLIDGVGRIFWVPTAAQLGDNAVQVRVSDPRGGEAIQQFNVTVAADTSAPRVAIRLDSNPVDLGKMVGVLVTAIDDVGVAELMVKRDGVAVPLDSGGRAMLTPTQAGVIVLEATATDAAGNVGSSTLDLFVADPNDLDGPAIAITSPAPDGIVTAPTDIIGTVADNNLLEYVLSVGNIDGTGFREIARGTQAVTNGVLGRFDPTLLPNDSYLLRLRATDTNGNSTAIQQVINVAGELKLGNFRLSFVDLSIPVSGIPITVSRTYDSLNANKEGDFGFGWTLDFRNADLRTSLPQTGLEEFGIYTPFQHGTRVYVTLPGGRREGFTFTPDLRVLPGFGDNLIVATPRFAADPGVTNRLSVRSASLIVNEFGELHSGGGQPYNPAAEEFGGGYTVTTKEGLVYRLDGNTGQLRDVTDRNANRLTFDDAGVHSSTGKEVTFERDETGRITEVIDPMGNAILYRYDVNDDLIEVVDREQNMVRLTYRTDRPHYLDELIDPLGRPQLRTTYDEDGRMQSVFNALEKPVSFTYEQDNSAVRTTNAMGFESVMIYDNTGHIVSTIDPLGNQRRYTYDASGNTTSVTTPLGIKTSYTYDVRGNRTSIIDNVGNTRRTTYNTFSQVTADSDNLGNTITHSYDTKGNQVSTTLPDGATYHASYDPQGNLISLTDPMQHVHTFRYDATGLVSATYPNGFAVTFQNDATGTTVGESYAFESRFGSVSQNWSYVANRNGDLERMTAGDVSSEVNIDGLGLVTSITRADGTQQTLTYGATGNVESLTTARGAENGFVYDALGHITNVTSTGGQNLLQFAYDKAGRRTTASVADGRTTVLVYDADGRVANETTDGLTTTYGYDALGRRTTVSVTGRDSIAATYDPEGRVTSFSLGDQTVVSFTYDALGRVIRRDFVDGSNEQFVYDLAGAMTRRTDRSGGIWRFEYDSLNALVAVVDPDEKRTEYGRDAMGNLDLLVDALGRRIEVGYDALGRRVVRRLPNGQEERTKYDAMGRVASIEALDGTLIGYQYDAQNRIISTSHNGSLLESQTYADERSRVVQSIWGTTLLLNNDAGVLTNWTDPNGIAVSAQWHGGLPQSTTTALAQLNFTWRNSVLTAIDDVSASGAVATTIERPSDGLATTIHLPAGDRIEQQFTFLGATTRIGYITANGDEALSHFYARGNGNRITTIDSSDGTRREYEYDSPGRLIAERVITAGTTRTATRYEYDAVGNRVSREQDGVRREYTYDVLNQLQTAGDTQYEYDLKGRVVRSVSPAENTVLEYDAFDRLVRFERTVNGHTSETHYTYDFDGLLLSRTYAGATIQFVWDRVTAELPMLLEMRSASGQLIKRFVHEGTRYLYSSNANGERITFVTDHVGSAIAGYDALGQQVFHADFDAFGYDPNQGLELGIGFGGGIVDPTTNLVYLRSRWYDPATGRFIQADTVEANYQDPASLHRYVYSHNDPVNKLDPDGHFTLTEEMVVTFIYNALAAIGIGVGGALATSNRGIYFISGGRVDFENQTGTYSPILEIGGSLSGPRLGSVRTSLGIAGGFEVVDLPTGMALFGYIGGNVQASGGFSWSAANQAGSVGVTLRTESEGEVYDAFSASDYEGLFVTITGGLRANVNVNTPIGSIGMNRGRVTSISWSPFQTGERNDKPYYAHTRIVLTGNGSAAVGNAVTSVGVQTVMGFSASFYFDLTYLIESFERGRRFFQDRGNPDV